MQTHVFVATTQGPVAIQKITPEDSDVSSVVCVGGGSDRAGIADRYYDFVGKGTGLIARETGHGAWRVDVSADIERGDSWQLAFFLAHVLHRQGQLGGGSPAAGDTVVLATGRVLFDRSVAAIDELPRKMRVCAEWARGLAAQGARLIAMAPDANLPELPADWRTELDLPVATMGLTGVSGVDDALGLLGGRGEGVDPGERQTSSSWRRFAWPGAVLGTILGIVAMGAVLDGRDRTSGAGPAPGDRDLPERAEAPPEASDAADVPSPAGPTLWLVRATQEATCDDALAEPVALRSVSGRPEFAPVALSAMCTLRLDSPDAQQQSLLVVELHSGVLVEVSRSPGGWTVPPPQSRARERQIAYLLSADEISEGQREALRKRLVINSGPLLDGAELEKLLAETGMEFAVYRQTLSPEDGR